MANDASPAIPPPTAPAPPLPGGMEATVENFGSAMFDRAVQQHSTSQQQPPAAQQPAANQPVIEGGPPQQQQPDPMQQAAEPQDPFAEQVHGVALREIVDAIKQGELPEALLTALQGTVKRDGEEGRISLREALNGNMRLSDYTRGRMELADQQRAFEAEKAQARRLFDGWDKPDSPAFEQSIDAMGMMPRVRSMMTKNWGTGEQPNIQGFIDDMHRLGHSRTFRAAAQHYANQYSGMLDQYGYNAADPNSQQSLRAHRMAEQWEQQQEQLWKKQVELDNRLDEQKRADAKRQREQLLRQSPQQDHGAQQFLHHVHGLKQAEYKRLGITPQQAVALDRDFAAHYRVHAEYMRRQNGGQMPAPDQIVPLAVRGVLESYGDERARTFGARPSNDNGAPQPPQTQGLPARPTAAPTTAAPTLPQGGTIEDFEARLSGLASLRR